MSDPTLSPETLAGLRFRVSRPGDYPMTLRSAEVAALLACAERAAAAEAKAELYAEALKGESLRSHQLEAALDNLADQAVRVCKCEVVRPSDLSEEIRDLGQAVNKARAALTATP